ncbi:MAG: hypothetical protein IJT73_07235 [Selenomonadaceae bacterium]|nr:hypothetical protein [Selenomonadaceae bacterium]
MKKFLIPLLLIMCTIFSANSVQAYPTLNDKPNVAVMKIKNKALVSKEINEILAQNGNNLGDTSRVSEFFIKSLINTGRFHLVERENSLEIADELSSAQNGLTDTSNAPQTGKLKVAHYLILGSLTGITTKDSGIGTTIDLPVGVSGGGTGKKRNVIADVIIRFVNVETGEIVLSVDGRGESDVYDSKLSLNVKGQEVYQTDDSGSNSNNPLPHEESSITLSKYEFNIGSQKYNSVQVANAIKKAVQDAIYNKKYGLLAELDGTAEGERF